MKYLCMACDWQGENDERPFRCPNCWRVDKPIPPELLALMSPDAIHFANDDSPPLDFDKILKYLDI
jgi:hypothetical protein